MIIGVDHVVLYSADADATIDFYRQVLGCTVLFEQEWRSGQRPVFGLRLGDADGIYINVHPPGPELHPRARQALPGGLDICVRVDRTADQVVDHLTTHGVAIEVGPAPRLDAFGRRSTSFYIRDPDANLVELMVQS